ncbi:MAG: hypothetical protein LLF83_04645 [Methanobacterium sp.]|nr:hypothetical protein [Methanobacterium sp.]
MANARKCDRCGKLYEEYNVGYNKKKPNGIQLISLDTSHKYFGYFLMDLCPDCMDQFQEWLKQQNSK